MREMASTKGYGVVGIAHADQAFLAQSARRQQPAQQSRFLVRAVPGSTDRKEQAGNDAEELSARRGSRPSRIPGPGVDSDCQLMTRTVRCEG